MTDHPALGAAYLCYTIDTDETQAAAAFVRRYGHPPAVIVEYRRLLWLGPVEQFADTARNAPVRPQEGPGAISRTNV